MFRRASLLLAGAAAAPPWSAWDACAATYARSVAAIFPRHTTNEILTKLPPPTTNHPPASDRTPLVLLAPGSSGTASLWWASAMLNLTSKHHKDVWLRGGRCGARVRNRDKSYKPKLLFTKGCGGRGCEFVADWPAQVSLSTYWSLAPAARFIMIDFDADNWRATRLTFRGGWCTNAKRPDCRVPLAFDADDAWHDTAVAVATANQTAAAAAALKAFLRCVVPPSQLLWLNWQMPTPTLWARLSEFARVPLPPTLDTTYFPRSRTVDNQKSCAFNRGSCKDALACVMWDACAGVCHGRCSTSRIPEFECSNLL
ncbi:unnamed protein product [Pelagomonas calceolata]|uniref:Uncharacterized protein n=1 Tax=Pelagomonas calceolata TaxID=35677 RepID=A0A8J2WXU1_9STRA|nr:unnamed protein product [Pelagomonas calceolata]